MFLHRGTPLVRHDDDEAALLRMLRGLEFYMFRQLHYEYSAEMSSYSFFPFPSSTSSREVQIRQ